MSNESVNETADFLLRDLELLSMTEHVHTQDGLSNGHVGGIEVGGEGCLALL